MRKPHLEELESRFVLSGDGLDLLNAPVDISAQSAIILSSMGTYDQVAGSIPSPTSAEWFVWYNALKQARLDYSMQPRAQTFYFSTSGNDATGDGSQANPWQSLAKARAILTQTGGNVALLFKRGDEFYDTFGLNVSQPMVTIGAYGDTNLAKPMFSAFTIKMNANTNLWTQVAGTNSWTASASTMIGWIRNATSDVSRLSPYTYLQTSNAVSSISRSWTWNNGTLYLNPGAGVNPNTINWEAVGNIAQDGILMSGDGGLITDIRADGWGCVAGQQYQNWGIKLAPANNWSVVAMNTESYYNGRHGTSVHSYLPSSTGGFALLLNNVSGYTNGTASQTTIFNTFSPGGGNEVISEGNIARFGRLPDFNLIGGGIDTQTPAFYGHTGNQPGQTMALNISVNDKVIREFYQGASYTSGMNTVDTRTLPGDNSVLSSLRHFVVNYQVLIGQPYTVSAPVKTVQMNSLFQITGSSPNSGITDSTGGWYINCIWAITDPITIQRYFINAFSAVPTTYLLYNSFLLDGPSNTPSQAWDIAVNQGMNNASVFAANNVFARTNNRNINLNIINDADHLLANAYYQVSNTNTYSGDPFAVTLSSAPNLLSAPSAGSALIGGAKVSTFGYTVDYDFYGRLRNLDAPTLGAIEFNWSALPVTDAGQYYIVHAGQSLVLEGRNNQPGASYAWDVNGDGIYTDAIGNSPTLSWAQLAGLGIKDGGYFVRLRTTVGSTITYSDPAYLEVLNRTPYADAGNAQTIYGGRSLTLDASGSFSFTADESLSYSWDVNGDGIFGDAVGVTPTLTAQQLINLGLIGGSTYSVRVKVAQSFDSNNFSISAPVSLTYFSIVVDTGGPYVVNAGQSVVLTAGDSGPSTTYSWDLNNDGIFGDALGRTVSYTTVNNGVYTVGLQVSSGAQIARSTTTITALNVAPTVTVSGPTAVSRKSAAYTLKASDSPADLAQSFTYLIDWEGDGVFEQSVTGSNSTIVNHSFSTTGMRTVHVKAIDAEGAVGPEFTFQVNMSQPYSISNNTLYWYLSDGDDIVSVTTVSANSFLVNETMIDGQAVNNFYLFSAPINAISIDGQSGNDTISIASLTGITASVLGGYGDDTITGSSSNDNIDGGEGNDTINVPGGSNTIDGAEGNDRIIVQGNGMNYVTGGDGDDTINTGSGSDTAFGGMGNDQINTADGNDFIDGAEGYDYLQAGSGDDCVVGGADPDTIFGGDGNDLLFGGTVTDSNALMSAWNGWITNPVDRHTPIIAIAKNVVPLDDVKADSLSAGTGFDVTYNDVTRAITISQTQTGFIWAVASQVAFNNAFAVAQPGDTIYVLSGTYTYSGLPRSFAGITIRGLGIGNSIIRGGFIFDNQGDQRPTIISNLTIDHSGMTNTTYYQGSAYNLFSRGTFYFDTVDIHGPGTTSASAVHFWGSSAQPTYGYISNSNFYVSNGDVLSTWGGGANTSSQLEIYNSTFVTSGPLASQKVISANNGFRIILVGGVVADSAAYVMASDSITPIDAYYTIITSAYRNSGITIPVASSIFDSVSIYTLSLNVFGTLINSTITAAAPNLPAFIYAMEGSTIQDNKIVGSSSASPATGSQSPVPLRVLQDDVTVVDNVFQNWNGVELDILAGVNGTTVSGNSYQ